MFRARKLRQLTAVPKDFNVEVPRFDVLEDGTKVQTVVSVPVSSLGKDIPNPEDYTLSKLMAAGVPLNQVSANILDSAPTESEVNSFLDSLPSEANEDNNNNPEN